LKTKLIIAFMSILLASNAYAADSRKDIITKIESQRATIREHIVKYDKFKKEGSYTSTAETTIKNSQAIIKNLINKTSGIPSSPEDS
jgi:hypothetical protein